MLLFVVRAADVKGDALDEAGVLIRAFESLRLVSYHDIAG